MSRIPPELESEMTPAVKAAYLSLLDQVERLTRQVERLTAQVQRLTPRNSSMPPSVEHPHAKPKRKRPAGAKRKPGAQKGHKRHTRQLVPTAQCSSVTQCVPESCRRCGGGLERIAEEPIRHQVFDLPPIQPLIDEYQLFRGHCPCCGVSTTATLPDGIPRGQCGPRLAAFTGLLVGHFRQSKRRAAAFLSDLLNIPASPGWIVKTQSIVSDAIYQPYEELRNELADQRQLFVDESPTMEKNKKAWLWVAVAPRFAVFGIFKNRSRESLSSLVGSYREIILNCDRAKMYLDCNRLQWCWAHLKRDFQRLIDSSDGQASLLGRELMREHRLLFEHWRRYKAGKLKWGSFCNCIRPVRRSLQQLLLRGKFSGNNKLTGFCNELYQRRQHLWTFTRVRDLEPTNNTAERALRPAVIQRKLSFGTQSASGSRYLERMLTMSETCRLQQRNAYQFLIEAIEAKIAGSNPPSLMPVSQAATPISG